MHPFADLSAYLDGALAASERSALEVHLAGCATCRSRVAELAAATRLIATLPSPAPHRSLIPRLTVPAWMAPLRTASALGSAGAALLFLGSVLSVNPTVSTTGIAPAAAPLDRAAPVAPSAQGGAAGGVVPSAAPLSRDVAPPAGASFALTGAASAVPASTATSAPERSAAQAEAAKSLNQSAEPQPRERTANADAFALEARERPEGSVLPWLWLALAALLAMVALVSQRRLRRI